MKKIILSSILSLLVAGLVMAQPALKVVESGDVCVGCSDPGFAKLKTKGVSQLEFALDANGGNADFTMQLATLTKAQVKYNIAKQGLQILARDGNATEAGLADTYEALFVNGTNRRVGIGTSSPASKLHVAGTISHQGLSMVSDKTLKNNIRPLNYGLKEIMDLSTYSFIYNGKGGTEAGLEGYGVVAQELQKVIPELVSEYEHNTFTSDPGGELSTLKSSKNYLSVNTSALLFVAINAIKDQQKEIEAKDSRITELEERFNAMEEIIKTLADNQSKINQTEVDLSGSSIASLKQNVPNPFNNKTSISYEIPSDATTAEMNVYNLSGVLLKKIPITHAGKGEILLNAIGIPAGTYTYQLIVDGKLIDSKKMGLIK